MRTGLLNLAVGIVLGALGASGRFRLLGGSPKLLLAVGAAVAVFGIVQIVLAAVRRR